MNGLSHLSNEIRIRCILDANDAVRCSSGGTVGALPTQERFRVRGSLAALQTGFDSIRSAPPSHLLQLAVAARPSAADGGEGRAATGCACARTSDRPEGASRADPGGCRSSRPPYPVGAHGASPKPPNNFQP